MSDYCSDDKPPAGAGGATKRTVMFYACSGGANVAEVADQAARELMYADEGGMFCLAGIAAGIEDMVQAARDADLNIVMDGCSMDCAKKVFDNAGVTNYVQFRVTDLGFEKVKGLAATDAQIAAAVKRARLEIN